MQQKLTTFVLAEASRLRGGEALSVPQSESAPHYFGASVPKQVLIDKEEHEVNGQKILFEIKAYQPDILLVEAAMEVDDVFSTQTFDLREALIDTCHKIVKRRGGNFAFSEEYAIALVSHYEGEPEQFFEYGSKIASFLKSEKLPLDEQEVEHTLSAQLKYAKDDLVIVDWDGAFIFDPDGECDSITKLLQVANLQLLRYRILDASLDERFKKIAKAVPASAGKFSVFRNKELEQAFREVISVRARSTADFEALDREIKLIGDWYSARLYELVARKMRFDSWKEAIKEKLDSLEDVYSIIAENLGMSRTHFLEFIQILLFFVLQVGWFVLIILEFVFYTSH